MSTFLRAAIAGLVLAVCTAPGVRAEPPYTSAAPWPKGVSDIRPDPETRFGELPNGMRYMIMHNATPAHETAIRLRIASGSLMEKDGEQGVAHMIEHMAFKGSTHVAEGEMVKLLERHGLAFGADTNAFTTYTQTFYQLNLPESDDGSIDLALMLMRETCSEVLFAPKALDAERNVILAEERDRATPSYEAGQKALAFRMPGQLAPDRAPIGKLDVIRTIPAERLRTFYDANYRPDRATLIVVGDIDVDAVETKIKARFADWHAKGPAPKAPSEGRVQPRRTEANVVVQPGLSTSVSVEWTQPHDATPDTRAKEEHEIVKAIGLAVINHRLGRMARSDDAPFLAAVVGMGDQLKEMKVASLAVVPKNDDWRGALAAANMVRRQAVEQGVQPAELVRVLTEARERSRGAVVGKSTRPTAVIATLMLNTVDTDEVYSGPLENYVIFESAVKDLTVEKVDAALREVFAGEGPLISMSAPKPLDGGARTLLAGFTAAERNPLKPAEVFAAQTWPYTAFGAPGAVVRREEQPEFGVTYVYFANGVTLTFKPTRFAKDQALVEFELPGGRLTLPSDRPTPLWEIPALGGGGTRQISVEDIDQTLAGRVYGMNAQLDDEEFVVGAGTRRIDLNTELQMLTAYISDPGWRPSGLERIRSAALLSLDQVDSTPTGAVGRRLAQLLHSGDRRWEATSRTQLVSGTLADAHALWDQRLQGPVNVVIVGDLPIEEAIAAVARTVGALPARGPAPPPLPHAKEVRFPEPTAEPIRITHKGRADQAVAFIGWPTNDFFANPREARALSLAARIMEDRLLQRVRNEEGSSYAPSALSTPSDTFPGYGMVSAAVETTPGRLNDFFKASLDIAAELRDQPVSADELERARRPIVEQVEKAQETNGYWLSRLIGAVHDRRRIEITHQTVPGYKEVTTADIQAAARKYLSGDKAFKVVAVPESRIASAESTSPAKD